MVNLLKGMLEFNPYFRLTARECLKNKIFNDIRISDVEQSAPFKIKLQIYNENNYNYEEAKSNHTIHDYKVLLLEEIKKLRIQNKFKQVSSYNSHTKGKLKEKVR